jgi:hypothetical protein
MVKQPTLSPETAARALYLLLAAIALTVAGCANLRPVTKASTEGDPLRGARHLPAMATTPTTTNDRGARLNPPAEAVDDIPTLPATLAPSPAALTVAPRLRGDTYLGIDTPPAGSGSRQPVQPTGWTGNALSREQAWEQLRARGVTWQQLDRHGDQWRLQCSVPNPTNPNASRFYEAVAADEVSAIWAVIEKIDGQR